MPVALTRDARTRAEEIHLLWCQLTGTDPESRDPEDVAAFLARPEVRLLGEVPDSVLQDAATAAVRGRSLPLERWLAAVRIVRPSLGRLR